MKGLKTFVIKNDWLNGMCHGWGNGYVAIPKEHPLYGKHYSDKVKIKNPDKVRFNDNYIGLLCVDSDDFKNMLRDIFPSTNRSALGLMKGKALTYENWRLIDICRVLNVLWSD